MRLEVQGSFGLLDIVLGVIQVLRPCDPCNGDIFFFVNIYYGDHQQ